MTIAQPAPDGNTNFRRAISSPEARAIRQNHQQLQHVVNRILNFLDVPDKAARGISGIHGALNGRVKLPAAIKHRWTARQLHFRGDDDSARKFMGRVLDAIDEAERRCGRRFFEIRRNVPLPDDPSKTMTFYDADYISEVALWALLEAKASPAWAVNPAEAVDQVIPAAVDMLPRRDVGQEDAAVPSLTDAAVIKGVWTKVENLAAKNLERVVEAGGDPVREARRIQDKLMRLAISARKRMLERDRAALLLVEAPDESPLDDVGGPDAAPEPAADVGLAEGAGQSVPPKGQNPNENDPLSGGGFRTAALAWAARGMAVLPLYGVADGVCDCRKGSECDSPGKHPLSRLAPHGVKDATTDPERIRAWWEAAPLANVGIAMGGELRLLAVDVDPRAGGDASLYDLVEAHGDEWLSTLTVKTGGLGNHFIYRLPEGVKVQRGKLAPGIDIKAEGGYLVAAPSLHALGRCYRLEHDVGPAEAPAWLVEELTRPPAGSPAKVIQFQEGRRARPGDSSRIPEGERNRMVFKIGCAIWGAGEVADLEELYSKLLNETYPRCDVGEKPFTPGDVWKIAKSIMRYPRGGRGPEVSREER